LKCQIDIYIYDENFRDEQVKYEYFKTYNTIIIESGTGTGKTTNTAKHIKKIMTEERMSYKVLSIISRITMADQHIQSFKKEGIELKNYQKILKNTDYDDNNVVICINSILRYQYYKADFFKNYIVYLDEINTFTRHLTHNNTLDDKLKLVYVVLNKIINNCYKLVCTESIISDNVFNLLENRPDDKKIFIRNTYKNYEGIKQHKKRMKIIFLRT